MLISDIEEKHPLLREKRIVFLVTEDWYFLSHRLPMARAALHAGMDVQVATRVQHGADAIAAEGFEVIALNEFKRERNNPWQLLKEIVEISRLYRRMRPDVVHHVAVKPAVVGSLAARLAGINTVVSSIAGFGFVYVSRDRSSQFLRPWLRRALRYCLKRGQVIVQNPDDRETLLRERISHSAQISLIKGSGVDVFHFSAQPEPKNGFTVALVSRMLWDKGVGEYVEAIRRLKSLGSPVRALLVGDPDPSNPRSISAAQLAEWSEEGVVEVTGHVEDVRKIWAQAHVAVLPSYYREGLPKTLMEAAACQRPMIAADVPGCREIVHHGETGLLVPPRDPEALAQGIETLMRDPKRRQRMGESARRLVVSEMSDEVVGRQILAVYKKVLASG